MEIVLGFIIAVAIGVTGVGAGVITAPVLILFMHVTPAHAVGTALAFSVAVKMLVVPMQIYRKQVDYRVLGYLLAGGVPGVLTGSYILAKLEHQRLARDLYAALGSTIVIMAAAESLPLVAASGSATCTRDWSRWLPAIALPIGAEVGFSSAGAGAIGSLALLWLTPLSAARVVGTDLFFGLCLSLIGSGFQLSGRQLRSGYLDETGDRRRFRRLRRNVRRRHHSAASLPRRAFGVADHARHPVVLERRPPPLGFTPKLAVW